MLNRNIRSNSMTRRLLRASLAAAVVSTLVGGEWWASRQASAAQRDDALLAGTHVVFAANDLGMHCMGPDFTELMVLPPFNNLHAQVIRRGIEPDIVTEDDVTVEYFFASNTRSADKTNFWKYAPALFGVNLPADVGLTGNGMSGTMAYTGNRDYAATGIPITPIDDNGMENPYPLATVRVRQGSTVVATTQTVVPVSWEMSCNICHDTAGISTGVDILRKHDAMHGTHLEQNQPVNCSTCHADNALGTTGIEGVPNLSAAMHGAHAPRMGMAGLAVSCYACHPGVRTQCQRDIHSALGMNCFSCHTSMEALADPTRRPWLDEPKCADCHSRPGFEFEEPGKLFKESRGHGGVACLSCHGSPHAITPTVTQVDNVQAMALQGHTGVINDCLVCHTQTPDESFFHRRDK